MSGRTFAAQFGAIALLAGLYFVGGKLGLRLAFENASATAVWPPTGIALAALVFQGRRLWPGVLVGAFLVNLTTGNLPFAAVVAIAVGNTLEVVVGAWLVEHFASGRRAFERSLDTIKYAFLAGMVATAIAATIGTTALLLSHHAEWSRVGVVWATWWLGDMGGAVMLAPALFLLCNPETRRWPRARTVEMTTSFVLLVAMSVAVFGGVARLSERQYPLQFLCTPFLVWAAYRVGPLHAALAVIALAAVAIGGTLQGRGPFAWDSSNESLLLLQCFMIVSAIVSFVLAAAVREREEAEAKLQETARELARSNADLEHFAHAASHELKEPLRTVASFTQLLSSRYHGRLGSDADQFIGFAVGGATRMQRLIDDLLTYAHAGSKGLRRVEFKTDEALTGALAGLRAAIDETGATVTREPLPTVHADPGQLTQLFQNLISNAIKFRRAAAPRIHVSTQRAGAEWIFSVRDNGIGVEPRFAERIFAMFERVDAERYDGSGIGLALSKRIVERHGGRIWMESEPGKGSTVHFTLPADAD